MEKLKELFEYRSMIYMMVKRSLRGRYKKSILGFAWTFLNPLLQLAVYTFVFSMVIPNDLNHFSLFIFVALIPWIGFSSSIIEGSVCFITHKNLVTKINFPREVLPIITTLTNFINMLLCMIVVILSCAFINGIEISLLPCLVPIILIEFVFTLGLTFVVSSITVYFNDLQHIINIVLMAWQFLTPIMYSIDIVPEKMKTLFYINPMTSIILAYRNVLYDKISPDFSTLLLALLYGIVMLGIGWALFRKLQKRFAEVL